MAAPRRLHLHELMRPVIGLTLRPEVHYGQHRIFQNTAYLEAIIAAGGLPMAMPVTHDEDLLREMYDRCDALLLPGGPDVEPRQYGEEPRADCDIDAAPDLDATELPLARWAVADELPTLGICRGAQVLNVALGGTLWQDIAVQVGRSIQHDRHDSERHRLSHEITITPESRLHAITGDCVGTNSLHHQAIREVAATLTVAARSPDDVIEAVETRDGHRFLIGVQAHPEELVQSQEWARRLFDEFVAAAR